MKRKPYAALVLNEKSRADLLKAFPPKFSDIRAHHITIAHGTDDKSALFKPQQIRVVGYACDDNGVEALLLEIDGQQFRHDGKPWHITISFEGGRKVPEEIYGRIENYPLYRSTISNQLLGLALNPERQSIKLETVMGNLDLVVEPQIVLPRENGPKVQKGKHPQPTRRFP